MGLFSKKENSELFVLLESDQKNTENDHTVASTVLPPKHALTVEEVTTGIRPNASADSTENDNPLAALQRRMAAAAAPAKQAGSSQSNPETAPPEKTVSTNRPASAQRETLLDRCKPYTTDSSGRSVLEDEKPAYTLESFQEIFQRDSEETLQKLQEKYGIVFEDTSSQETVVPSVAPEEKENSETEAPTDPPLVELSDFDPIQPTVSASDGLSQTATIRFTPVRSETNSEDRLQVSTQTRPLDLTREITSVSSPKVLADSPVLSKSEFETFPVKDNPANPTELKEVVRKYALKRRNSFLQVLFSGLFFVALAAFYLPFLSGWLLHAPKAGTAVCTAILTGDLLLNADLFFSLPKIFNRRSSTDSNVLFAVLAMIICGIAAALSGESVHTLLVLGSFLLLLRSFSQFMHYNSLCGNLRQQLKAQPLKAIALIDDPSATYSMAGDSIEGSVLVAAPQSANFIEDSVKYSQFSKHLLGKLRTVTLVSIGLAVLAGIAYAAISHRIVDGCYLAAAILCIAAMPPLLFSESLPNYACAAHMNKKGSFISGLAGAERLEQANAFVLSTQDIFPAHTVTLHDMKILSDNNYDRILVRAAALAEAMKSPLAPIFKRITDTNISYKLPDADSMKYEKGLGISGWVDEGILFIGNRKIMEAHGIAVPPIETDYRILESGFFPVYIAYGGKACALLSVQYSVDPEISALLHRATRMGLTVLFRNCDANLTDEMLCDYFGLYEDSVRIMSPAGVNMCRMQTAKTEHCSSPAGFRGGGINFLALMISASRVKATNRLLSVFYIVAACLGAMMLLYLSFSGVGSIPSAELLFLFEGISLVLSFALFLWKKP